MLQDFLQCRSFSSTNDAHLLGVGMGEHGWMDKGLVVRFITATCGLKHAVQENLALGEELFGVEGFVRFVIGLAFVVGFFFMFRL